MTNATNSIATPAQSAGTGDINDTGAALKFITCGSVDDGKSTLIGRLLVDSRSVLQDQLANVSRSGTVDLAQNWFWSQPGNAQRLGETVLLDITSITNIGILGGALWVSANKPVQAQAMSGTQWLVALVAGLLLGYSSRLAFGCNVGAMLSGISTGSVHGWIWVPLAFAGTLVGLRVRNHFGFGMHRASLRESAA